MQKSLVISCSDVCVGVGGLSSVSHHPRRFISTWSVGGLAFLQTRAGGTCSCVNPEVGEELSSPAWSRLWSRGLREQFSAPETVLVDTSATVLRSAADLQSVNLQLNISADLQH